ncbi:MAG: hypothetical protein HFJ17_02435 [Clostridia bacterium]|nr:hypothetical protein [Clostridia bacterium]
MNNIKKTEGITLISLIITVIVIAIITSVSITQGTKLINKTKAENIESNMLMVKAKAKEQVENVDAKNWAETNLEKKEIANQKKLSEEYAYTLYEETPIGWTKETGYTYYSLGQAALDKMELNDLWENEVKYIVKCPKENGELDIIYKDGIKYDGTTYYTLSELQEKLQKME